MTTPPKPWEGKNFYSGLNSGGVEPIFGGIQSSQNLIESSPGVVTNGSPIVVQGPSPYPSPPPLPQRSPHRTTSNMAAQGFQRTMASSYSPYGMGGYPYSPYGGYPRRMMGNYGMGYGMGMGFNGYQDEYDSSMMQAIEDSCQTLFGPFESLVRSISSIAMVLDSTHQAMQFSFRTVLSAADSLSKLKNLIIGLASSFSIIKILRSFYYKILQFLGLVNKSTIKEKEWSEVFSNVAQASGSSGESVGQPNQPSAWLALGFFSLMMGGPYLMFKLFAQNLSKNPANNLNNGLRVGPDAIAAVALYDFDATCAQELSMKRGDQLKVSKTSTSPGWALATNGTATGFIPTNRAGRIAPGRRVVNRIPKPPAVATANHQPMQQTLPTDLVTDPK